MWYLECYRQQGLPDYIIRDESLEEILQEAGRLLKEKSQNGITEISVLETQHPEAVRSVALYHGVRGSREVTWSKDLRDFVRVLINAIPKQLLHNEMEATNPRG